MPDYKKLYIDLFNRVTDEIGYHIQRLQEIQQKSTEEYTKDSIPIRLAKETKSTTNRVPNEKPLAKNASKRNKRTLPNHEKP